MLVEVTSTPTNKIATNVVTSGALQLTHLEFSVLTGGDGVTRTHNKLEKHEYRVGLLTPGKTLRVRHDFSSNPNLPLA